MKIGIIGGGASGVYLAIRIKELNPSFSVTIIEKNQTLLKKVGVTGNGRCNYANIGSTVGKYHNDKFANKILNNLPSKELIAKFDELGIHPYQIDDLVYPVSLNAQTVVLMLNKRLEALKVNVALNEQFLDYQKQENKYLVKTNKNTFEFDRLVIASGAKAYPQLGTDGTIFDILSKHQYKVTTLSPSLTPIKVKENTKKISGQRQRCSVSLKQNGALLYQEDGEVLFKDDGLSGIVILNMSQKINELVNKNNVTIHLDLAASQGQIQKENYEQFVSPKINEYLLSNNLDIHDIRYTFKDFYDFDVAQVTAGGLDINEVNDSLESKKEKGLYFIGEFLDVDGMCGGYNLMFAFASGETVAKSLGE